MKRLLRKFKDPKFLTTDVLDPGPAVAESAIVTSTADPMLSVPASVATASAQFVQAAGVTVSVQPGSSHR